MTFYALALIPFLGGTFLLVSSILDAQEHTPHDE